MSWELEKLDACLDAGLVCVPSPESRASLEAVEPLCLVYAQVSLVIFGGNIIRDCHGGGDGGGVDPFHGARISLIDQYLSSLSLFCSLAEYTGDRFRPIIGSQTQTNTHGSRSSTGVMSEF